MNSQLTSLVPFRMSPRQVRLFDVTPLPNLSNLTSYVPEAADSMEILSELKPLFKQSTGTSLRFIRMKNDCSVGTLYMWLKFLKIEWASASEFIALLQQTQADRRQRLLRQQLICLDPLIPKGRGIEDFRYLCWYDSDERRNRWRLGFTELRHDLDDGELVCIRQPAH